MCTEWLKKYKWNAWNFGQMNELNPCMDLLFSVNSFNSHFTPNESLAYELGPYMAMHNLYGFAHSKLVIDQLQCFPSKQFKIIFLFKFIDLYYCA